MIGHQPPRRCHPRDVKQHKDVFKMKKNRFFCDCEFFPVLFQITNDLETVPVTKIKNCCPHGSRVVKVSWSPVGCDVDLKGSRSLVAWYKIKQKTDWRYAVPVTKRPFLDVREIVQPQVRRKRRGSVEIVPIFRTVRIVLRSRLWGGRCLQRFLGGRQRLFSLLFMIKIAVQCSLYAWATCSTILIVMMMHLYSSR